jgi:hypothetical protein
MIPWDAAAMDAFTASVGGHVPALWAIWNDWGGSDPAFPISVAQQVAARGSVPMIWWQPVTTGNLNDNTFTNQRIINGDFDTYIRQWASDATSYGGPVVLRFAQEMEGNWFPWGVGRNGNTASNFITAWQHIWNIFRGPDGQGATNVRFLWSPYIPTASIYPGAQYVDYVGFTALNWAAAHGDPWRNMNNVLSGLVAGSRQFNKPIIVAELGSNPIGGNKASWITNGYAAAYSNYPEIVALVYFNVDTSPGQPDWRLTTPADALTAYREILTEPQFQGRFSLPPPDVTDTTPPTVGPPVRSLAAPATLGTTALLRLSWPVASDSSGVARYELQARKGSGAWANVTLPSPTAIAVDVRVRPNKKYTFRLRATDGAGNTSGWVATSATRLALLQETAAATTYSGTWTSVKLAGASGNHVRYASAPDAVARLAFNGTAVALVSTFAPDRGQAEVWLDGVKLATLDLYSPTTTKQAIVWASAVLAPGLHTLELRPTGGKNPAASASRVDLDAFLILQ